MNKELEEAIKRTNEKVKKMDKGHNFFIDYEQEHKDLKLILNYIDNSISKEVIEEKIEEYKQQLKNNTKRVVQLQVLEQNKSLQQSEWEELNMLFGDIEKIRGKIEALEELLKKN